MRSNGAAEQHYQAVNDLSDDQMFELLIVTVVIGTSLILAPATVLLYWALFSKGPLFRIYRIRQDK